MTKKIPEYKKWIVAVVTVLTVIMATGCSYFNFSVLDSHSTSNNEINRTCELWSGFSVASIVIGEEDSKDIVFYIDLKKGSVAFDVVDEEGNEVYTVKKEEAGVTTDTFTAEKSGTYSIKESGKKFSGEYKVSLGTAAPAAAEETEETAAADAAVDTKEASMSAAFVDQLVAGNYAECGASFTEELKAAVPEEALKDAWEKTTAGNTFVSIEKTDAFEKDGYQVETAYCIFALKDGTSESDQTGITVTLTSDQEGKIAGLNFNYYHPDSAKVDLPAGIEEEDLKVGEGTKFELSGKLTRQEGVQSKTAVLLVHGSGPQDMDETINMNKPFRDLAWGLAEQGIDVLRYDKRTYAHATKFTQSEIETMTVEEETIQDAIAAAKLLQEKGYETIYLAGHSLGGMLAPRIEKESDGLFSGLILLAGSPRKLTDIVIDQNEDALSQMTDEAQVEAGREVLEAEKQKYELLPSWSEEERLKNTVFGMPAYYLNDLISTDYGALAAEIEKPILVLQGDQDFQVYADKDYVLWQELLKNNKQAQFILYEGLNHFFMLSEGENAGTVDEYKIAGKVSADTIDDIAEFIKNNL